MVEGNVDTQHDRCIGPDFWTKALRWLGIFGWFVIIVALFIIDRARPEEVRAVRPPVYRRMEWL